jgi:hypothetical protein
MSPRARDSVGMDSRLNIEIAAVMDDERLREAEAARRIAPDRVRMQSRVWRKWRRSGRISRYATARSRAA